MKRLIVLLAAFALARADTVGVAEKEGLDESESEYQNDDVYRYISSADKGASAAAAAALANGYATDSFYASYQNVMYDKIADALVQCARERVGAEQPDLLLQEAMRVSAIAPRTCTMSRDSGVGCTRSYRYQTKYYFNQANGRCEKFHYRGCGGNSNNFRTEEECQALCAPVIPVAPSCSLPADKGPCDGYIRRFYYSRRTERCEMFIYGGCGGNGNNFLSRSTCDSYCSV